jgi:hypothetical protein
LWGTLPFFVSAAIDFVGPFDFSWTSIDAVKKSTAMVQSQNHATKIDDDPFEKRG